jgi:protein TonB
LDGRGLPIPVYPAESRRRNEQGLVELEIEILADGTIGPIEVITDPGFPLLVQSAIDAVQQAKFDPATSDGKPIRGKLIVPFRFTLQ